VPNLLVPMLSAVLAGWLALAASAGQVPAAEPAPDVAPVAPTAAPAATVSMDAAQRLFYVGRYEDAAAMALRLREAAPDDLATYELRTSALHFLIKRALGATKDPQDAVKRCAPCTDWLADLKADTLQAQQMARTALKGHERDPQTLFYLGKIDLTHVWLHLGTLGQKTGWNEYWEARHSLDDVLKVEPTHVRARVARAWIDYIVDTRVPLGLRWVLGGGSKKRALASMREAAATDTDFFSHAEANFALWEMLVREKRYDEAVTVAEALSRDFPENRELVKFVDAHQQRAKTATEPGA
jgi:tetratricopeptide (TPR) repeat protein